jgi:chaperonin GroES
VKQQLRPLFDQVVIKELDPDRVRRSGLVLPPGEHETPPQHGIVLEEERLLVCRVGQLLGVLDEVEEPGEPRLGSGGAVSGSAE